MIVEVKLAGLMALAVVRPNYVLHIIDRSNSRPVDVSTKPINGVEWSNEEAKPAFVILSKDAAISGAPSHEEGLRKRNGSAHYANACGFSGLYDMLVSRSIRKSVGHYFIFGQFDFDANLQCGGATYVLGTKSAYQVSAVHIFGVKLDANYSSLGFFRQRVRSTSFIERSFDQPDANGAKSHSDQGGYAHDASPPSRHFLSGQVLFLTFVLSLGLASLAYTVWLGERGRADPFYTIFGVLAVYLGALGCFLLN
jgi:hypothetical protein